MKLTEGRLYLYVEPRPQGWVRVTITKDFPKSAEGAAVIRSKGTIQGEALVLDIPPASAGPQGPKGETGTDGLSAYQVARQQGYGGTASQWLATLRGDDGKSAYDLARSAGYGGTLTQWLASLVGSPGKDGASGKDGVSGKDGAGWVALPDVTLSEGGIVVALGPRKKTVACAGAQVGDRLQVFSTQGTPAGYVMGDCACKVGGQIEISFQGPALTLLTTNTIPLRVVAFR